jgi:hypothetical protein
MAGTAGAASCYNNVYIRGIFLKKFLSVLLTLMTTGVLFGQQALASAYYATGSNGVDVSFPNCSASIPRVDFGVVGLNGGIVYSQNNCAASEASHFGNLSLYVNTGLNASASSPYYPQALAGCNGDVYCAAYSYGFSAAQSSISYARSQGLNSSRWWLDVETMNSWSSDVLQNQKSLQGQHDAILGSGVPMVGVYSTTAQWQSITGGWKNNWPSWGATTWTTAKQAATYCTGHQFTGGSSLLMQYRSHQSKLDQDVAC